MATYASNTSVDSHASRAEIERTLARYGATDFMYASSQGRAMIAFVADNRQVRFTLPLPDRDDPQFTLTPARRTRRSPAEAERAWEQATRQKWRALALMVKAKLEAVESGIVEFEQEFLAHIVLPDGSTVYESVAPQVSIAYETGRVRPLLQLTA